MVEQVAMGVFGGARVGNCLPNMNCMLQGQKIMRS
jgi:hypothetical protein